MVMIKDRDCNNGTTDDDDKMTMRMGIIKDLPHNVQSMVGVEGAVGAALIMGLL